MKKFKTYYTVVNDVLYVEEAKDRHEAVECFKAAIDYHEDLKEFESTGIVEEVFAIKLHGSPDEALSEAIVYKQDEVNNLLVDTAIKHLSESDVLEIAKARLKDDSIQELMDDNDLTMEIEDFYVPDMVDYIKTQGYTVLSSDKPYLKPDSKDIKKMLCDILDVSYCTPKDELINLLKDEL